MHNKLPPNWGVSNNKYFLFDKTKKNIWMDAWKTASESEGTAAWLIKSDFYA